MSEASRVRSRIARMTNPWFSIVGTISCGQKVRYCDKCKWPVPVPKEQCPKCLCKKLGRETISALNYFRFAGFPADIFKELRAKYNMNRPGEEETGPVSIPFTFPGHPSNFVRIGRNLYQGKSLHCENSWVCNRDDFKFSDTGFASRRMEDGITYEPIPCVPEDCPYVIGGNDPYLHGKKVNKGQCGEHVTAYLLLYEIAGLELVRFKSGGIKSIESFLTEIRKILALTGQTWKMTRLELRIRMVSTKYYSEKYKRFMSTTVPQVYIHFPFSVEQLAQSTLALSGDVTMKQLPEKIPGTNFDELVDGPRQEQKATETKVVAKQSLSELKGRSGPPAVQSEPIVNDETSDRLRDLILQVAGGMNMDYKVLIKVIRGQFAFEKGQKLTAIPFDKALRIIRAMERRLAGLEYDVAGSSSLDEYERQEYEYALEHPDDMWSPDVIKRYNKKYPGKE